MAAEAGSGIESQTLHDSPDQERTMKENVELKAKQQKHLKQGD